MEFDKSKVLTCVTVDQAKVGKKGWFAETLSVLENRVEKEPPKVLERVWLSGEDRYIFRTNNEGWSLFYPAPEPTYAERQAEWVTENNVKIGTKVRVTRGFKDHEDGSDCGFGTDELRDKAKIVGQVGRVDGFSDGYNIYLKFDTGMSFFVPYTVLEVVKEPTYEERQAEWIKKHNLKEGDKVKVLRTARDKEDGWCNSWVPPMTDMVGRIFTYVMAKRNGVVLICGYEWPYFVLEVVKEPTYRPYNNDELNDLVGKVLIQNHTGNAMMAIKVVGGEVGKLISLGGSQKRNAQQLLDGWTHKNGEPCGVMEES